MKEKEKYWVAGLLEGEGSFIKKSKCNGCYICCTMTDLDVLEKLQRICGGKIYKLKKRQAHWKDSWRWRLGNNKNEAFSLMSYLQPLMGKRRQEQISICLKVRDLKAKRQRKVSDVRSKIKEMAKSSTHKEVANYFKVSRSYVSHIVRGKYD